MVGTRYCHELQQCWRAALLSVKAWNLFLVKARTCLETNWNRKKLFSKALQKLQESTASHYRMRLNFVKVSGITGVLVGLFTLQE